MKYESEAVPNPTRLRIRGGLLGGCLILLCAFVFLLSYSEYGTEYLSVTFFGLAPMFLIGAWILVRGLRATRRTLTTTGAAQKALDDRRQAESEIEARRKGDNFFGQCVSVVGGLLAIGAVIVFFCMVVIWLKRGAWPDWSPLALGYLPHLTKWIGVNKIVSWFYERQIALLLLTVSGLLIFGGEQISETAEATNQAARAKLMSDSR